MESSYLVKQHRTLSTQQLNYPTRDRRVDPLKLLSKVQLHSKMAPDVVSKLQSLVTGESKSARKKKAKGETGSTAVPAAREQTASEAGAGGSDPASKVNGGDSENAYVRELQK
jgi:hypothetical protein